MPGDVLVVQRPDLVASLPQFSGIDVVVEEVMMTPAEWEDWRQALEGLSVRWVGVRCDLDVVSERERTRGDRYLGLARGTGLAVHRYATYDVEIDTSSVAVEHVAAKIDSLLSELETVEALKDQIASYRQGRPSPGT